MINYQYFVLLFSGMCTDKHIPQTTTTTLSYLLPNKSHPATPQQPPEMIFLLFAHPPLPQQPPSPPTPNKHYISSKPVTSITVQSCAWQCREWCQHCTQLQVEISRVGDSPTDLREGSWGSFPRAGGACPTHTWLVRFHPNLSLSQHAAVEQWFWPQGSIPPQPLAKGWPIMIRGSGTLVLTTELHILPISFHTTFILTCCPTEGWL